MSKLDDRGESLVELLVALGIMATAVVALLGALATGIRVSELHRHQTRAGAYLREFAETLERRVAESQDNYRPCGSTPDPRTAYESLKPPAPSGYQGRVERVKYWNKTSKAFEDTCPGDVDPGVQLLSLLVNVPGATSPVTERLDITLRKPCREGDNPCGV